MTLAFQTQAAGNTTGRLKTQPQAAQTGKPKPRLFVYVASRSVAKREGRVSFVLCRLCWAVFYFG